MTIYYEAVIHGAIFRMYGEGGMPRYYVGIYLFILMIIMLSTVSFRLSRLHY